MYVFPLRECATASVMSGLGDVLAQLQNKKKYDWKRTVVFMAKGYGEGFLWSVWYRRADIMTATIMGFLLGGRKVFPFVEVVLATLIALILDLTIACPIIYGCWDIPFPAVIRGKVKARQVPGLVKRKLPDMLLASLKVWTPVNILIYNSPVEYRVLLMSVADVFWQSIVSAITTAETPDEKPVEENKEVDTTKVQTKVT